MEEFYVQIRFVHIASVIASGSLFAVRALAFNLAGAGWPKAAPVRYFSYTIDTILLTAALMLTTIVAQYPFVHGWLTAKVGLLVVYIGLGMMALRPARPRPVRLGFTAAALAVFLFIVSVAQAHHPLGLLSGM